MDGGGRTAWQLAASPCTLAAADGAADGAAWARRSVAAADPSSCPTASSAAATSRHSPCARWEYWSGLAGLESTWWESGSAISSGGLVRLFCLLQM
ncbi:hypothetical protein GPECTOR_9g739 [Gonium pectorale]|uniref:Uncharacterized protein n=1 Tax=Gonium pectorale TaxID=33097 RepID=A0A150GS93_GONPE|nr:hypothetical protein GPECTOR_9g739 [Gonium pectorale]|eukprot:KXZ52693.1 hypothetical protein GPECTOR_9g739 [Gonium pectorale]